MDFLDQRMRGEEIRQAAAERACAVAVDYAQAGKIASECGVVQEFLEAAGGFLHCAADHVDFIRGGFLAGLGVDRYPAGVGRWSRSCRAGRGLVLDSQDVGERNFHSQRAC